MNIIVIVAHPDKKSFNHAIASTCLRTLRENRHEVVFHDLYEERFDPVLPPGELQKSAVLPPEIERHCKELSCADGLVIVHPNWWGQPPAILTGWIDRIIRPGVAYEFIPGDTGEGVPRGLLGARCAIIFNTANTQTGREMKVFGDPLEKIWKSCIFELCGVKTIERRTFTVMVSSSSEDRKRWLTEVAGTIDRMFPRAACMEKRA